MEPLFQTSLLGFRVKVFKDRLVYKALLTEQTIPIKQIASIEVGMPLLQQIIVETTGGKKHKIVVRLDDKPKLRDLLYDLISKQG